MDMKERGWMHARAHSRLALSIPVEHVGNHLDLSLGGSDFLLRRGLRAAAKQGEGHFG